MPEDGADSGERAAPGAQNGAASVRPPPLDEVMLAMDVVDTLRHRRQLVAQELRSGERDEEMLERLRQIYAAQGLEVPDHILREGVTALREERFVYRPPGRGLATRLARMYVDRGRWAKRFLLLVAVMAAAFLAYDAVVRAPRRALRADLAAAREAVRVVAKVDEAQLQCDELYGRAQAALRRNDRAGARSALGALEDLRGRLEAGYTLLISTEPDTGVWRIPDVNPEARNYYIIVEAVGADGRRLTLPILNEETGRMEQVMQWGLRVDEDTFERVRADKLDDGIIENRVVGEKRPGHLEPEYAFPTTGGAITDW